MNYVSEVTIMQSLTTIVPGVLLGASAAGLFLPIARISNFPQKPAKEPARGSENSREDLGLRPGAGRLMRGFGPETERGNAGPQGIGDATLDEHHIQEEGPRPRP